MAAMMAIGLHLLIGAIVAMGALEALSHVEDLDADSLRELLPELEDMAQIAESDGCFLVTLIVVMWPFVLWQGFIDR